MSSSETRKRKAATIGLWARRLLAPVFLAVLLVWGPQPAFAKYASLVMDAILGPFEAWLLLRGMRTMALRVPVAAASAMAIAEALAVHPKIEQVLYPGLPDHPGHQIALDEWDAGAGFTAMLSIRVKGGAAAALKVATSTRHFLPATSLGGVESLIEHRKTVEDATSLVPEDLLRLSVGIEATKDLIADLNAALEAI